MFRDATGYVCISRRTPGTKTFDEDFFVYPEQLELMLTHIDRFSLSHDVYYAPMLLDAQKRTKEHVTTCPTAWADLDTCDPAKMLVPPTIVIESSPNRWQALWVFDPPLEPHEAEELSRRIAYFHADDGADKSGWDLTQLLRVPYTYNHKYKGMGALPTVKVVKTSERQLTVKDFKAYPEAEGHEYSTIPFPDKFPTQSAEELLDEHRPLLNPQVWHLFGETPKEDWSRKLWQLEQFLFEAELSREEVFVIAKASACNKYQRDGRSDKLLWKDVCRAWSHVQDRNKIAPVGPINEALPALLTEEERATCMASRSLVEEYIEWAKTLGDAAWQYHEAGAFVILSSLLAGPVRLPTSFGTVLPNLWFMILADTTLTRKTTAMDIAMDIITEIDSDTVLATDGSIEGLMTSLSLRPGRPSIFLRDEFSGLLEAITKKDYYAGMAETLTKLYDGKLQKRVLRKEIIEVRDPILIFFAGGIKTRVLALLSEEHVASGFVPRFITVSAESDVASLKPLGPPSDRTMAGRANIVEQFGSIYRYYHQSQSLNLNGKQVVTAIRWDAELSPPAWARYNEFEATMLKHALESGRADLLTPAFDRLSKSGLKVAVLIAASRMEPKIVVQEDDVIRAFYYIEKWRGYTYDVIRNIGKTASERQLELILDKIRREPGVLRSRLMQHYHLTRRDADLILETLEQRGLISRTRSGKTERLNPVEAQ